jgi:hypothetical protein
MLMTGRLRLAIWTATVSVLSACSLLVDPYGLARDADDAAPTDALADSLDGRTEECPLASPPPPPSAADKESVPPLRYVLRTFFASENVGFDLDGRCTGAGAGFGPLAESSCTARTAEVSLTDGPGGVDNATAALLRRVQAVSGFAKSDLGFDQIAAEGRQSVVVELSRFNGTADDPDVTIAVYESPGLEEPRACDDAGDAGSGDAASEAGTAPRPTWSGCDTWSVAPSPPTESSSAWVKNGVGVARFETLAVRFGEVYLRIRRVVATLRNANENNPKVTLSGTIDPAELVDAFGEAVVAGTPVCRNAPLFAGLKQFACDGADVYVGADAAAPRCNGLSFGAEFATAAIRVGGQRPTLPLASRCAGIAKTVCGP